MRELSLAVVGIAYPNQDGSNRRFEIAMLTPGEPVELRREPHNRYDPHAVGVWSQRGIRIGYLSAERAPWIGGKLAGGEEIVALFQAAEREVAVIRVRIGGGRPTVPPQRPSVPAIDHDHVDPDGPEWGA
jgi:hypothetical protein